MPGKYRERSALDILSLDWFPQTYKHLTLYDGLLTDELKKTRRFVDPRSSDKADKELASRWKADLAQASGSAAEAAQGLMDASLVSFKRRKRAPAC